MMLCNCINLTRLWEETQDGKYPPSTHAPSCEHYKPEEFAKITFMGSSCVVEKHEVTHFMGDDDSTGYKVEPVMLTRDQFEKLPEFDGF